MALEALVERVTFAGGEAGPALRARSDLGRYQISVEAMENYVVLVEGAATRRPGTRFVLPLKTESQKGKLVTFRRSSTDYYTLVINGGKARFVKDGGFLEDPPGTVYEITVPWAAADVANIRSAPYGNTIIAACKGKRMTAVTRSALTTWAAADFLPNNGPVKVQNLDQSKTIAASGTSGTVSLTGAGTAFNALHVGSVWRIDEGDLSLVANWKASETLNIPLAAVLATGTKIGDMTNPANAFDANAGTAATKTAASGFIGTNQAAPAAVYSATIVCKLTNSNASVGFVLYGKVGAAPGSGTDGTVLASIEQVIGPLVNATITLVSSDATAAWDYQWIYWAGSIEGGDTLNIYEITRLGFTAGGTPVLRRYNGNVYQAISGTTTGLVPPTHAEGDVLSEPGGTGVIWRYRHGPSGFFRITTVTDATHATATVMLTLPDSVTVRPSYRWFEAAWSDLDGWPELVTWNGSRMHYWRGAEFWASGINDPQNMWDTGLDDGAFSGRLQPPDGQSVVEATWAAPAGALIVGTTDLEWLFRSTTSLYDALTIRTLRPVPDSSEGSIAQIPALVDGGVIFVGKNGKRLIFGKIDPGEVGSERMGTDEVSVGAKHVYEAGIAGTAWQRDPNRVLWSYMNDGAFAGLTFMRKEKVLAAHRHPMTNGIVEDVAVTPSTVTGNDQVTMIVRRTINGVTRRYVEQLQDYFAPLDPKAPTAEGAWLVDCGLRQTFVNAVTAIGGLGHLEGQSVALFVDGAMQARQVVAGGAITLPRKGKDVLIGLPIKSRLKDLPRNLTTGAGPTTGLMKTTHDVNLHLLHCGGGMIGVSKVDPRTQEVIETPAEDIIETGGKKYGKPIALFSGLKRMTVEGEIAEEAQLEIVNDDAMPCTVLGFSPHLEVEEVPGG